MSDLMAPWRSLDALPAAELVEPRLRLHHAAQLAACVGQRLLPKMAKMGCSAIYRLQATFEPRPWPGCEIASPNSA